MPREFLKVKFEVFPGYMPRFKLRKQPSEIFYLSRKIYVVLRGQIWAKIACGLLAQWLCVPPIVGAQNSILRSVSAKFHPENFFTEFISFDSIKFFCASVFGKTDLRFVICTTQNGGGHNSWASSPRAISYRSWAPRCDIDFSAQIKNCTCLFPRLEICCAA